MICAHLSDLQEIRRARTVLGYAAFGSEVDVDGFLRELLVRDVGVLVPWVDGDQLRIARIRDLDADLAPGWRGVREPRASGRREARPDRVDVVVVPGVAFDRQGHRLGYGGGHFDRLLASVPSATPRIGVAFATQLLDAIPAEDHDVPVDIVVTEEKVIRPGGG